MSSQSTLEMKEAESVTETQAIAPRTPADLLALAIQSNLDLDKLEKLMELQERWDAQQAKRAFFDALTRFQEMVPDILKTKKGYEYVYAPLGDIEKVIKSPLAACGLSKRWEQEEADGKITIACVITHRDGHSERSPIGPVDPTSLEKTKAMNTIQQRGAVITYMQRYSLISALGLATADADVDARVGQPIEYITESQVSDLEALIQEVKADKSRFCKWAQVTRLEEIRATEYTRMVRELERKRK